MWLYLQPTMSTRHRTETVEVIDGARLELRRKGASPSEPAPAFYGSELGSFSYNVDSNDLSYQRIADPGPLLVTQDKPQQPLMVHVAERWSKEVLRVPQRPTSHVQQVTRLLLLRALRLCEVAGQLKVGRSAWRSRPGQETAVADTVPVTATAFPGAVHV
ncbi:hypothetical protein [Streptomyces katrae]|uniref:hypothetical protein n=1 Tax=Streptomyces katrae TaxID=68223 RepID=UPI0004BF837C|nr:hypothetical protein [Streptomyces katrae]